MEIRKTTLEDLPRLIEIYQAARNFMTKTGNPKQWGKTWPPKELIKQNIIDGNSYVCEHNGIIGGTFFFNMGKDIEPTYKDIKNGNWTVNKPYGVMHRLASDGSIKGIGAFCINWCFEQCKHLRIDTHPDNKVMRDLLLKLGFKQCGIIQVLHDDMPRLAFEKVK